MQHNKPVKEFNAVFEALKKFADIPVRGNIVYFPLWQVSTSEKLAQWSTSWATFELVNQGILMRSHNCPKQGALILPWDVKNCPHCKAHYLNDLDTSVLHRFTMKIKLGDM